jgi:hypothetical protein
MGKLCKMLVLLVLGCSFSAQAQAPFPQSLAGTWYVVQTNFPMWTSGTKIHPQFRYTPAERNGTIGLIDSVVYEQHGKQKVIAGFDALTDAAAMRFMWRGNGWMHILRSHWQVVWLSPDGQWAIIAFEKTLFTPAGHDVICRNKRLDPLTLKAVAAKLTELGVALTPVDQ